MTSVGSVLGDRYRLLRELGRGGMGEVYEAQDERLGRRVAIKCLYPHLAKEAELMARFEREARAVTNLRHPRIVQVFDFVRRHRPFLVCELLEGETLRERLERQGGLEPAAVASIAAQMLDALACAHDAGIVHRDVKPANVFLVRGGELGEFVKMLDFGIARNLRDDDTTLTQRGALLGTLSYMAPEQSRGRAEARSDIYAVGAVMYHALSGKKIRQGDGTAELLEAALFQEPPPLGDVAERVPAALAAVVHRALARSPDDRFADARAMIDALRPWLDASLAGRADTRRPSSLAAGSTSNEPRVVESQTHPSAGQASLAAPSRATDTEGATLLSAQKPQSERDRARRNRSPLTWVLPGGTALALAGLLAMQAAKDDEPPVERPASASVPLPEPEPPVDAAALAAFRAGLWREATERLQAVTTADPTNAAAYLRLAIWQLPSAPSEARRSFQLAMRNRDELDARQASLLDASEPYLRQPWDLAEWQRRLTRHLQAHRDDLEARYYLAFAEYKRLDFDAAIAELDAIVAADAQMIAAWSLRGEVLAMTGDGDGTLSNYARCLKANPSSPTCLQQRGIAHSRRGDCKAMLADASRLASVNPDDAATQEQLVSALLATGAPRAASETALERSFGLRPENERALATLEAKARYAFALGDFALAEQLLRDWSEAVRNRPDQFDSAEPAILLLRLFDEQGRVQDGATIASDYLARLASRAEPVGGDLSIHFHLPLARVGKLNAAQLDEARRQWTKGYRNKWQGAGRGTGSDFDWIVWSTVWGFSVTDEAEAERALAAMPSSMPDAIESGRWWAMDLNIGRVLALTGESERATVHLARAAGVCERLDEPHVHPLANALLGRALADSGHPDEAIEAFERAIASWGEAPRSTSAAMARKGLQSLRGRGKP